MGGVCGADRLIVALGVSTGGEDSARVGLSRRRRPSPSISRLTWSTARDLEQRVVPVVLDGSKPLRAAVNKVFGGPDKLGISASYGPATVVRT